MINATPKQTLYLASLIADYKDEYPTLEAIWNATPENDEKRPYGLMRKVIFAERLSPLTSYEASYIIGAITGKTNKYNKKLSTKQAFQYLNKLNLV